MTISNLLFRPWIGKQYGNESVFKIPILIVGESNWGESKGPELDSIFTHQLINSIIDGSWKHNFFSNIQRTFVESASTEELRSEFWHSVAHYEYIQDWISGPGIAPDKEMWKKAKPIFQEVVADLNPNPKCILFVCKQVFDQVSPDFPISTPLSIDEKDLLTLQKYKNPHPVIKINNAFASWIYHPMCPLGGFRKPRGIVRPLIKAAGGTTWV